MARRRWILHGNGDLLGDKVVLSGIIRALRAAEAGEIIGVEGNEFLSMKAFLEPPDRIVHWRDLNRGAFLPAQHDLVIAPQDRNSIPPPAPEIPGVVTCSLWRMAHESIQAGFAPALSTPWAAEALPGPVVIHHRNLPRNRSRNTDYMDVAELSLGLARHGLRVLVLGDQDPGLAHELAGQHAVCLAGRMSPESFLQVLATAQIFIGGDSGPRHTACAFGRPIICLGQARGRHGPFPLYPGQVWVPGRVSDALRLALDLCYLAPRKHQRMAI